MSHPTESDKRPHICLLGLPGAGKSSVAKEIVVSRPAYQLISSGDIARSLDERIRFTGAPANEDQLFAALEAMVAKHPGPVVLDGYPRTFEQMLRVESLFGQDVLYAEIVGTPIGCARRLLARNRPDDTPVHIVSRMRWAQEGLDEIHIGVGIEDDVRYMYFGQDGDSPRSIAETIINQAENRGWPQWTS